MTKQTKNRCYNCGEEKPEGKIFCSECEDKPRESSKKCLLNIYESV